MDWTMDMTDAAGIETIMYQWPRPAAFNFKDEYYPEYPTTHQFYVGKSFSSAATKSARDDAAAGGASFLLNQGLMLKCLEDNFLKIGGEIRYQSRAVQLLRKGKGRVTGVIARDKEGNYVQFNTRKAVVLCTGDYGNNPEMMQKYCSFAAELAAIKNRNTYMLYTKDLRAAKEPLNVGDGHQMAMWIGAVMEPASIFMITLPMFMPLVKALGFEPLWYAVIMMINTQIGLITPPFGMDVYTMKAIAPADISIEDIFRSSTPFLAICLLVMALVMAFPRLALWLPGTAG
jgi:hypothetical protein